MLSGKKIIQFVGPPCSGKTAISKALFDKFKSKNIDVFYFDRKPINFLDYSKFRDRILISILFASVFFYSLCYLKSIVKIGFKNNLIWIRRICMEWENSIICRRFLISISNKYEIIIADHCLESMYLFEVADPRNVVGLKLLGIVIFFMKYLPLIKITNTFFTYTTSNILKDRLKYKNKIVRFGLSDLEKDIFFNSSIDLLNFIRINLPMPYFSKKYEFIDTSFRSSQENSEYIYNKIMLS